MQVIQNGLDVSYETWVAAIVASACIGLTSLVPWLFNMTFFERRLGHKDDKKINCILAFAIGAILGDIFFHLIPESINSHYNELRNSKDGAHKAVGISVLAGLFMFIIVEIMLEKWSHPKQDEELMTSIKMNTKDKVKNKKNNARLEDSEAPLFSKRNKLDLKKHVNPKFNINGSTHIINQSTDSNNNNNTDNNNYMTDLSNWIYQKSDHLDKTDNALQVKSSRKADKRINLEKTNILPNTSMRLQNNHTNGSISIGDTDVIDAAGYLSLIANGFDNFTHGLAIGASFLVSSKVGFLTTFVIFIHEIPHEICDYAILVNSGFTRWDAVKAQSSVSLFGILGTVTSLYVKSIQALNANTMWILPFSAGGFLYIALVNLLPEVLREKDVGNSLLQIACVIFGITFMGSIAVI